MRRCVTFSLAVVCCLCVDYSFSIPLLATDQELDDLFKKAESKFNEAKESDDESEKNLRLKEAKDLYLKIAVEYQNSNEPEKQDGAPFYFLTARCLGEADIIDGNQSALSYDIPGGFGSMDKLPEY